MTSSESHGPGRPCPEWADALVEHSLAATERPPAELQDHLSQCERCSEYLHWLTPATDLLAEAVPGRTPPRQLKQRVMGEVRADAGTRAGRRGLPRPRAALAGAAVAAALAGGAIAIGLGTGSESFDLSTAPAGATGELVVDGDAGTLHLTGIRRPGENRVYQAWIRHGSTLEPSNVFVPDRTGDADASIPEGLEDADELLVTIEPEGGSEIPTAAPRLIVALG